ncbi:MAG: GDSL-type esterase/lipase family protein, partial [Opitutaceae bacterium]
MGKAFRRFGFIALSLAAAFGAAPVRAREAASRFVPASSPVFRYEGRFDFRDPSRPAVIWQASRIRVDFDGPRAALRFADLKGQVFFDAHLDGSTSIVALRAGASAAGLVLPVSGAGRHRLILFKRSEAAAGTVRFLGIALAAGARAWTPPAPRYRLKMEFFGDSITAGACDEDGPADQWENRLTHDAAGSYAALVPAAFFADGRNFSVSGMGVSTGWAPVLAGQVWDKLYPEVGSPRADLAAWKPDVLFILLGENDGSYCTAKGRPFPRSFANDYVALVEHFRRAYPDAHIVLLRGAMENGARNPGLRAAWTAAVARLEAGDPRISHYVFIHWTSNHPRLADHRALAAELISWLKRQRWMKSGRA